MTDIEYTQENQQAQPYKNHWWEVELVRKEQRIAELEQRLAELELRLGCCRDASTTEEEK